MNAGATARKGRVLSLLALALAAVLLSALAAVAGGLFDPRPLGPLRADLPLRPLAVPAAGRALQPLPELVVPPAPFSVKLRAALAEGERDSGYGLVLETESGQTAVLVSPLGYTTIAALDDQGAAQAILPWQIWPHVRTGTAVNEIWIDVAGAQTQVRLNGELMWQGALPGPVRGLGLVGESFGETAVISFERLELYGSATP